MEGLFVIKSNEDYFIRDEKTFPLTGNESLVFEGSEEECYNYIKSQE